MTGPVRTSEDWLRELGVEIHPATAPDEKEPTRGPAPFPALELQPPVNAEDARIVATDLATPIVQSFNREEVILLASQDLDFFATLVLGEIASHNYPPVFKAAWQLLTTSTPSEALKLFPKIALGLPRGLGKTTLMKLFICWCILFTNIRFFLIVACTAGLAENILADVADMLETENIKRLFGDWKLGTERDTQQLKKFGFRGRNIIIAAIGAGGSLRGLNLKHRRPDFILMDDIQKKEDAESLDLSDALLRWMLGTLMKTKPYTGCVYVYIGNMYPGAGTILKKLKHSTVWTSFICGALLADGESIWPELVSKEQLLEELRNDTDMGHPEIFFSEVLNDEEAGARSGIDVSKIPACPLHIANNELPHQGACVIIDPASGKLKGNDVAIGLFKLYDGVPYLAELKSDKLSPGDTVKIALEMALRAGTRLIIVESIAYQYTLIYWFNFICDSLGLTGFEIVELPHTSFSKNAGIKQGLQALIKGEIMLYPAVRAPIVYQIIYWNPIKKDNVDDSIDLLRMIGPSLGTYGHLMISESPQESLAISGITVLSETEMLADYHHCQPALPN